MEHYSAVKKKERIPFAASWMDLRLPKSRFFCIIKNRILLIKKQ